MIKKLSELYNENNILVILILLLVAYIVYVHIFKDNVKVNVNLSNNNENKEDGKYIMYGVDTCGWTVKQKKELGELMDKVKYVNCKTNPDACKQKNIQGYPSWEINGVMSSGFKTKDEIFG